MLRGLWQWMSGERVSRLVSEQECPVLARFNRAVVSRDFGQIRDVNAVSSSGLSLLHLAVQALDWPLIDHLLSRNANPNAKDLSGDSPLHVAVRLGLTEVAEALLLHGADATLKGGSEGLQPIHVAVYSESASCIKLLVEHGVDLNAVTTKGKNTSLHLALLKEKCSNELQEIIFLLVANGASLDLRNRQKVKPSAVLLRRAQELMGLLVRINIFDVLKKTKLVGEWTQPSLRTPKSARFQITKDCITVTIPVLMFPRTYRFEWTEDTHIGCKALDNGSIAVEISNRDFGRICLVDSKKNGIALKNPQACAEVLRWILRSKFPLVEFLELESKCLSDLQDLIDISSRVHSRDHVLSEHQKEVIGNRLSSTLKSLNRLWIMSESNFLVEERRRICAEVNHAKSEVSIHVRNHRDSLLDLLSLAKSFESDFKSLFKVHPSLFLFLNQANLGSDRVESKEDEESRARVAQVASSPGMSREKEAKPAAVDVDADAMMCVVCFERPRTVLNLPCRHLGLCETCSASQDLSSRCLICSSEVTERMHIFIS